MFIVEEGEVMYVISRVFKCTKREHVLYKDFFLKPTPMNHFKGFLKKEVMVNSHHVDYDEVRLFIFFESKKAFYQWEGSPEYIALHKDKNSNHHQKLDGILEMSIEKFDSLGSVIYTDA